MKACIEALPGSQSIAYFDTSFHRPIPLHIASYAIDQNIAKKRGLKKYGFHGLSCKSPYSIAYSLLRSKSRHRCIHFAVCVQIP